MSRKLSLAVIYDHREVLNPLFAALSAKKIRYAICNPYDLWFALPDTSSDDVLIYNDFTAPPYQFKTSGSVQLTKEFLQHKETNLVDAGTAVINGSKTSGLIFNKTRQLSLFTSHQLPVPKTVATTARNVRQAASSLQFPIVIKESANHSDSLLLRIETLTELEARTDSNFFATYDGVPVIVQEWIDLLDSQVVRVDFIEGAMVQATQLRVSIHPDYAKPFLSDPHEIELPETISIQLSALATHANLDLVSIEYGIDRTTQNPVFLGIHPHNYCYQATREHEARLMNLTVDYIESRLAKVADHGLKTRRTNGHILA